MESVFKFDCFMQDKSHSEQNQILIKLPMSVHTCLPIKVMLVIVKTMRKTKQVAVIFLQTKIFLTYFSLNINNKWTDTYQHFLPTYFTIFIFYCICLLSRPKDVIAYVTTRDFTSRNLTEKYSGTEISGFKLPHRLHFSSRHNSFLHIFVIINSYFGSYTVSLLLEDKLVRKAGARLDTLGEEVETRTTLSPTLKHLYGTKNIKLESNILFIVKQRNTEVTAIRLFSYHTDIRRAMSDIWIFLWDQ